MEECLLPGGRGSGFQSRDHHSRPVLMPEAPVLSHRWRLPSTNCHLPARLRDCSLTHVLVPLVLRGRKPKATTSIGLNLREAILGLCRSVAHHGASQCLTEHGMLTASQKNKSVACGSHSKGSSSAGCCKDIDVCKSLQSAWVAVLPGKAVHTSSRQVCPLVD